MKRNLLIVDDAAINREMLEVILADEYNIYQAENGAEAIAWLDGSEVFFHAVLLDIQMPVCDGFAVLEYLNAHKHIMENLPVIIISGDSSGETLTKAYELGAAEYFRKPFQPGIVTTRIRNVIALYERNYCDSVTGLLSRKGFVMFTEGYLSRKERKSDFVVLYFDLQRFEQVNLILGSEEGDRILARFGHFLVESPLQPLTTARLESDHFACLVEREKLDTEYLRLHDGILVQAQGREFMLNYHCGIYPVADSDSSTTDMINRAKMAMSRISSAQNTPYKTFDTVMRRQFMEQAELASEFDVALKRGDFQVYYQPVVNLKTGKLASAEALIRWVHPKLGMISPGLFIPIAEQNEKVSRVDQFVLERVTRMLGERLDRRQPMIPVSINLSWLDIFDVDLQDALSDRLQSGAIRSGFLRIELTERSYATLENSSHNRLKRIRSAGIPILMDDFGVGYSSFSNLTSYAFDYLKLDMAFVRQIETNEKVRIIIRSMIVMCHQIGIPVIAEGVQTQEQVEFLRECDCDYVQGYYFYRPMPEADFFRLLEESSCAAVPEDAVWSTRDSGPAVRCVGSEEIAKEMQVLAGYCDCVRLLDRNCMHSMQVGSDGTLRDVSEPCFNKLGRTARCADCVVMAALRRKRNYETVMLQNGGIYSVAGRYIMVDDRPMVLETIRRLIDDARSGVGIGSIFDTIQSYEQLIQTDSMTGVFNRYFLETHSEQLPNITAVAELDIDHFKRINDVYGHDVGDAAIIAFAKTLVETVRSTDYVLRLGGDEFLILFQDMRPEGLAGKLEEIRLRTQQIVLPKNPDVRLTTSIGGYFCDGRYTKLMLKNVDQALYAAKENRDCVIIWTETLGML